ncbi:TIGR03766 family XrtG-associated glycosyltransferase [Companilactobacillus insicii]|uniref:TIGR03766 family XrtG-associated glycosyltransferase n=1 Tax=Companilactobacillus insicii TaxID=1732567 RepID=UPI000F78455C|nr:TIGR03766 family XrtG-associated glycosyltransferase [Companilactobacillus insicii]
MRRFYNFSHTVINVFWRVLFFLTLFFALISPNIIIGDNDTFGTSTTMVTTILVIAIVVILVMNYAYPRIHEWLFDILITHQILTAGIMLILVVIAQVLFVTYVHPEAGFDAGALHYAAISAENAKEPNMTAYYSLYPNNLLTTLFMHWLTEISGLTSWQFFDYVTLVLVDLSATFNLLSVAIVKRKLLGTAMYIHCAWLALFPSIIMPYTDAWVLPFVSLFLLCYFIMKKLASSNTLINQIFFALSAIGFGVSVVLTYFVKPSAIVPVIAIVIIELLSWLVQKKHFTMHKVILTLAMLTLVGGSAGLTYKVANNKTQNQTYINIDKSLAIPPIHFMAMGVYGEGGYDTKQAVEMSILRTKKEKTSYSIKMLTKRLKKLGPFGYIKFLIMKQRNNTADGTFAWLKEGHFFRENQKPSNKGISNKIKNYVFLYGRHIADFRFAAQLWWITLLIIIALGFGPRSDLIQLLRLSLVGGFMFLLLFEGGRSRYLIQYLPCILLLGTFSFERTVANIKRLFGWYEFKVDESENVIENK